MVAAQVRISPRAKAGFIRLAASEPPAALPAPTKRWASSMKSTMELVEALISSSTPFKRRSNSPFMEAPASKSPISNPKRRTPCKVYGTSPCTIRKARPSMTAVLPTPGSPTKIGLFLRRLANISTIWRISSSRPKTGSMAPVPALAVKSSQKR